MNADAIPPALARLQHMNHDIISGRNALTPVLNRDDAMREWERRQAGKAAAAQPYPQLEYLQQQAELAAAGMTNWGQARTHRYAAQPSSLSQSYQPTTSMVMDESDRRDAILSNVRNAARADQTPQSSYGSSNTANLSSPPQAYSGASATATTRYTGSYPQQLQSTSPLDTIDRRADIGNLYVPMQPDQYQSYAQTNQASPSHAQTHHDISSQHATVQQSNVAPSFYGPAVVASGGVPNNGHRNPFSGSTQGMINNGQRDAQRSDLWPR